MRASWLNATAGMVSMLKTDKYECSVLGCEFGVMELTTHLLWTLILTLSYLWEPKAFHSLQTVLCILRSLAFLGSLLNKVCRVSDLDNIYSRFPCWTQTCGCYSWLWVWCYGTDYSLLWMLMNLTFCTPGESQRHYRVQFYVSWDH